MTIVQVTIDQVIIVQVTIVQVIIVQVIIVQVTIIQVTIVQVIVSYVTAAQVTSFHATVDRAQGDSSQVTVIELLNRFNLNTKMCLISHTTTQHHQARELKGLQIVAYSYTLGSVHIYIQNQPLPNSGQPPSPV